MDLGWVGMTQLWSWGQDCMVDFKVDTTRAYSGLYRGDMREYFKESKIV